jgi:hypothetical protein
VLAMMMGDDVETLREFAALHALRAGNIDM